MIGWKAPPSRQLALWERETLKQSLASNRVFHKMARQHQ